MEVAPTWAPFWFVSPCALLSAHILWIFLLVFQTFSHASQSPRRARFQAYLQVLAHLLPLSSLLLHWTFCPHVPCKFLLTHPDLSSPNCLRYCLLCGIARWRDGGLVPDSADQPARCRPKKQLHWPPKQQLLPGQARTNTRGQPPPILLKTKAIDQLYQTKSQALYVEAWRCFLELPNAARC